jgi:hypothetical protein
MVRTLFVSSAVLTMLAAPLAVAEAATAGRITMATVSGSSDELSFTVAGTGWPPDKVVRIVVADDFGHTAAWLTTAGEDGAFTTSHTFKVLFPDLRASQRLRIFGVTEDGKSFSNVVTQTAP